MAVLIASLVNIAAAALQPLDDSRTPDDVAYARAVALLPGMSLHWSINFESRTLLAALTGATEGWVGLGVAEPTSGSMPGADTVVAWVSGGVATVLDSHTTDFAQPRVDACQDVTALGGEERNGVTTVHLSRPLDVAEGNYDDRAIPPGPVGVVFALGGTDELKYHGENRGLAHVEFYTREDETLGGELKPIEEAPLPDESPAETIEYFELRFDNILLKDKRTLYMCQVFDVPVDDQVHLVEFDVAFGDDPAAQLVHHVSLLWCSEPEENREPFRCYGNGDWSCTSPVVIWAIGMPTIAFPPEAGYRVGMGGAEEAWAPTQLMLQIHFSNPKEIPDLRDSSGMRVGFVRETRLDDVGTLVLGDGFTMFEPIPAGQALVRYESECPSACTSTWPHPVHLIFDALHMHKTGRQMMSLYRALSDDGVSLLDPVTLNAVEFYQFDRQQVTPVEVTLYPGDAIKTLCWFDTSNHTESVQFSGRTEDEMCFELVYYYPKINEMQYCGVGALESGDPLRTVCGPGLDSLIPGPNPSKAEPDDLFVHQKFGSGCPEHADEPDVFDLVVSEAAATARSASWSWAVVVVCLTMVGFTPGLSLSYWARRRS